MVFCYSSPSWLRQIEIWKVDIAVNLSSIINECAFFIIHFIFRTILDLQKIAHIESSHMDRTQFPLLLASYISVVYLLQLMTQSWYSFIH